MSFGFAVGDILAVSSFAWTLYRSCKGASSEFEEVSREVITLHTTIKELEEDARNPDSLLNREGTGRKSEIESLLRSCMTVLRELQRLVNRYKSLGTNHKRAWDRVKFGTEGIQSIREKLTFHTASITLFLTSLGTSALGRIEKKLDGLVAEIRAGKREPSILTLGEEDDDADDDSIWRTLKSDLAEDGFTKQEIEQHKSDIISYLRALVQDVDLEERGGGPGYEKKSEVKNTVAASPHQPPAPSAETVYSDSGKESGVSGIHSVKSIPLDTDEDSHPIQGPSVDQNVTKDRSGSPYYEETPKKENDGHKISPSIAPNHASFTEDYLRSSMSRPWEVRKTSKYAQDRFLYHQSKDSSTSGSNHSSECSPGPIKRKQTRSPKLKPAPASMKRAATTPFFRRRAAVPQPDRKELQLDSKQKGINIPYPRTFRRSSDEPRMPIIDQYSSNASRDDESVIRSLSNKNKGKFDAEDELGQLFAEGSSRFRCFPAPYDFLPLGIITKQPRSEQTWSIWAVENDEVTGLGSLSSSLDFETQHAKSYIITSRNAPFPQRNDGDSGNLQSEGYFDFTLGNTDVFTEHNRGKPNGSKPIDHNMNGRIRPEDREILTIEKPLLMTLEELYAGKTKKMKVTRRIIDAVSGQKEFEEKVVVMDIKPGYHAGTKIKFRGLGDEDGESVQDIHFIVSEVNYPTRNNSFIDTDIVDRKNTQSFSVKATISEHF